MLTERALGWRVLGMQTLGIYFLIYSAMDSPRMVRQWREMDHQEFNTKMAIHSIMLT